jgi:hypothetical protein
MPSIASTINKMLDHDLDYTAWKNFAIQNNTYLRPVGDGTFVNADGLTLYYTSNKTLTTKASGNTKLTGGSIDPLSMATILNALPDPHNATNIPDQMLFVDTLDGTPSGSYGTINAGSSFFWKGLLYLNANLSSQGIGASQYAFGQNPDDFKNHQGNTSIGASGGYLYGQKITSIFMDGVLYLRGNWTKSGNGNILGSLITKGGMSGSGTTDIYYDARLGGGILKQIAPSVVQAHDGTTLQNLVSGPIAELKSWN